jgi:hypothetical protein
MMAQQQAGQAATAEQPPADSDAGSILPQAVSDSLDIQLPADESDQPVIIDTTQTILPDADEQ